MCDSSFVLVFLGINMAIRIHQSGLPELRIVMQHPFHMVAP